MVAAGVMLLSSCAHPVAGDPAAAARPAPPAAAPTAASAPVPSAADVPGPTLPPNPCLLVTKAEAVALANRNLQDGVPSGDEKGVPTLCQYTAPPDTPGVGQVSVFVGDGALKSLQIDRDTLGHTFTKPAGIGEEAWLEDGKIFARKGSTWVSIELVTLDADPAIPDRLQAAVRTALGRVS